MNMTAEEMIEENVLLTASMTASIVRQHGCSMEELVADLGNSACYEASAVFGWLGY